MELKIRRKIKGGANAWKKLDGCWEKYIYLRSKEVFRSGVTPVYLFGPDIMAMTKTLQEKVEVCANNRMRRT